MILKADTVGDTPYKKFMFDTDFDELAERRERARAKAAAEAAGQEEEPEPEPEPEVPTFSEEDLARAREEGRTEGLRVGTEQAASATEKQIADALTTIVQQAQSLFDAQAETNQNLTHHAVSVASALVRKLFPTLNQQTAQDQVQSMLETALGQLSGEPEIIVRVPADLAEDLHGRIEAVSAMSGFRGNVKVLGDPALTIGECRLEWSSGGVMRSTKDLAKQLDEIVARNLATAGHPGATDAMDAETEAADTETADASPPAPAEISTAEPAEAAPVPADAMPEAASEAEASAPVISESAVPAITAEPTPAAAEEEPSESAPDTDMAPETAEPLTAENISAGPPPVPSAEIIAEAAGGVPENTADETALAPVPSEDLVAEPAADQQQTPEENDEAARDDKPKYGGADLELEDDLKE